MSTGSQPPATKSPRERTPEQLLGSVEQLIQSRVRDMAPHLFGAERDDAAQSARVEAWVAANRYSTAYGARYSTYVTPYITGAIASYLRGEVKQADIRRRARRLGGEYLAEEPDDFDLFYDDDARLAGRLQTAADRIVAAMVCGLGGAPPLPGEAGMEKQERTLAAQAVEAALVKASPIQRKIFEDRYRQNRPMKDIADEVKMPERTLRWHHEKLMDLLRDEMAAAGITELPEDE
jgi:RNA polymerase sigma factor (sigma-70 family)